MNKTKKDINKLINEHNKLFGFVIFFAIWSFVIGINLVFENAIFASIIFFILVFVLGYCVIMEILAIDREIEEIGRYLKNKQKIN